MKRVILIFVLGVLAYNVNSQTTHILNFDSTHVLGNTDTSLNISIGDSLVVIHNQDDDDFEVIINGTDTIGAFNIVLGQPIYELRLVNDTINSIKIIYFDPNQYRLINLVYPPITGITDVNTINEIDIYPNPVMRGRQVNLVESSDFKFSRIYSLSGQEISIGQIGNQLNLTSDILSGIYLVFFVNNQNGRHQIKKLIIQ